MQEIWKDIIGYEELYQVSNLGNIKRKENIIKVYSERQGEYTKIVKEKIINPWKNEKGYLIVSLSKNSIVKKYPVHRIVGKHFLKNPNNYNEINHKDENRSNNNVNNLEWCYHKYNINYGNHNKKISEAMKNNKKISRPVLQYTLDGKFIKKFCSINEASRQLGIKQSNIIFCCKKIYKQTHGFIFKYKELPIKK